MPDLVTYQTLTDLSPIRGTRMNSDLFIMYIPETKLHLVIFFLSYPRDNNVQ